MHRQASTDEKPAKIGKTTDDCTMPATGNAPGP